ncbi:hypothetical protein [Nocardia sp. NPDC052566]|uniref:hypothetical protein n=1 Tax=Nocardia sp. NPDC052566 TaxID=3364330 RepID=UPI0037C5D6AC
MVDQPVPNVRLEQRITAEGWEQKQLATRINEHVAANTGRLGSYSEESIRKLLRGLTTWPHAPYRNALCELFDSTPAELGLYNSRACRTRGGPEEVDMRRQEFLRGVVALPIAAALPAPVREAACQPSPPSPRCIGMEHVDRVTGWAALFRQADDAGAAIAAGMDAQLRVADTYLQASMPPHVHRDLITAVATFHRVVGWASFDRGEHAHGREDFDFGWHLVEKDGPWWVRAALLTCIARQAIYRGDMETALDKLGLASVRADKLSLLRRADIAAVKARAFGKQGNRRECVRAVIEAEQFFTEAQDEDHPDTAFEDFKTYYNHKLLCGDLAHGLYELAFDHGVELSPTIDRLHTTMQLSDEHARSRLISTAHLAALHLRRGDVDEGVALATKVVEKAAATTSRRVTDNIVKIYQLTGTPRIKQAHKVAELRRASLGLLRSL